jgi:hypothetical protein
MCKFCIQKHNEDLGITCGDIILKYTNTVITEYDGEFRLDSNEGSWCEINYCPFCGENLMSYSGKK